MFLKRIEMQGFKSFADKVIIEFDHSITGIVGPNGCGKSNITDAIRWVLGEQSAKGLRAKTMTDVIFHGSDDRKSVNFAEVTLVFDNTEKYLASDSEEIEVTRKIYRNSQDGEYYINRVPCRLKDIHDLIMDSGLGKDSLSIISQGNISSFVDSKPIERRGIFEEAAGVSKYKKRKVESLAKLQRTKENLDRASDILYELERQVSPLRRQAKKAEIYREKKQRLEEIEIAVLVEDIEKLNNDIDAAKKHLFDVETQQTMLKTTISVHESSNDEAKENNRKLDLEINLLQEKMIAVVNEIQTLETRKIEIDEKRKYAIEVGTSEEKIAQLSISIEEAKAEYEDRKDRFDKLNIDVELNSSKLSNISLELIEANQAVTESNSVLRRLQHRRDVLESMLKDPFTNQAGVKAVMDNQSSLRGVLGVVAQQLKPMDGYEEAISVALGGALLNIVTIDEEAARNAISFLKNNQSGRATFLPTSVLRPRWISEEHQILCDNSPGYLGVASDFVNCSDEFVIVNESLLQNVIVIDTLENGNAIANLLKHNYKIVTLDGDVIHKGGSMTGGKIKNSTSLMTAEKELSELKNNIMSQEAEIKLLEKSASEKSSQKESIERELMANRIQIAQIEPVIEAKRAKYERLKSDFEMLSPNKELDESATFADTLIQSLNDAYGSRDKLTTDIKLKRESFMNVRSDIERKEQQIRQLRKELDSKNEDEKNIQIDLTRLSTNLENSLLRLSSEYHLTFEYAKENMQLNNIENAKQEVLELRTAIEALGNINMDAPEQFSEVNERYEFLEKQVNDLTESRDKILSAIDEMDEVMKTQFLDMFNKINAELNDTFRAVFGGGKATLTLEDPNDILNTGIDIDAQPPGKQLKNIMLCSGGEKCLITICVLFSILKVRTIPLCIFDEVESALDQANVERFARSLRAFDKHTQFLVVTHRPGTMEECDVLYGVTMQKRGVSQMLKVQLKDAMEFVEESESGV